MKRQFKGAHGCTPLRWIGRELDAAPTFFDQIRAALAAGDLEKVECILREAERLISTIDVVADTHADIEHEARKRMIQLWIGPDGPQVVPLDGEAALAG